MSSNNFLNRGGPGLHRWKPAAFSQGSGVSGFAVSIFLNVS